MYNLIFYYIYRQQINKGNGNGFARFNGGIIVFVAFWLHIFLIMAIAEKYFNYRIDIGFFTNNKIIGYSFSFLCMWLAYLYYNNKRIKEIEARYSEKEWFNNYGGGVTLLLIFVPLISIAIILS